MLPKMVRWTAQKQGNDHDALPATPSTHLSSHISSHLQTKPSQFLVAVLARRQWLLWCRQPISVHLTVSRRLLLSAQKRSKHVRLSNMLLPVARLPSLAHTLCSCTFAIGRARRGLEPTHPRHAAGAITPPAVQSPRTMGTGAAPPGPPCPLPAGCCSAPSGRRALRLRVCRAARTRGAPPPAPPSAAALCHAAAQEARASAAHAS
jgi:hypothetical protein